MSGADEAEAGGLRVGRFVTDSGSEPLDSTAVNADTQLIPMVETRTGDDVAGAPERPVAGPVPSPAALPVEITGAASVDSPPVASTQRPAAPSPKVDRTGPDAPKADVATVRAVARRAAAALPALGPDGPSEVPASVKSTAERRRQARGEDVTGTTPAPTALVPPPQAPLLGQPEASTAKHSSAKHSAPEPDKPRPGRSDAEPVVPAVPAGAPADFPGHDADRVTDAEPVDSPLHAVTVAIPFVPVRAPAPDVPVVDTPTVAVPVLTTATAPKAVPSPAAPSPVPPPSSPVPAPSWPVPAPSSPVPLPWSAVPGTEGGLAEGAAETTPSGGADSSRSGEFAAAAEDAGAATQLIEAVDPIRPGPPVLTEDSWDAPLAADVVNDLYQGRRRATVPWKRVLLIIGLIIAVTAIFVVPMALRGPAAPPVGDSDDPGLPGYTGGDPYPTDESGQLVPAASSPGSRQSQRASRSATPAPTSLPGATTSAGPTSKPAPTTPPPPAFAPVVMQAENATMSASSWQRENNADCTAGTPVVRTGKWTEYSPSTPGTLTFTVSVPSAGAYSVIVYAVVPSGSRRADLTVNGAGVPSLTFTQGCPVSRTFAANLGQGNNQIRFTNASDRGPTIDRIEIRRA